LDSKHVLWIAAFLAFLLAFPSALAAETGQPDGSAQESEPYLSRYGKTLAQPPPEYAKAKARLQNNLAGFSYADRFSSHHWESALRQSVSRLPRHFADIPLTAEQMQAWQGQTFGFFFSEEGYYKYARLWQENSGEGAGLEAYDAERWMYLFSRLMAQALEITQSILADHDQAAHLMEQIPADLERMISFAEEAPVVNMREEREEISRMTMRVARMLANDLDRFRDNGNMANIRETLVRQMKNVEEQQASMEHPWIWTAAQYEPMLDSIREAFAAYGGLIRERRSKYEPVANRIADVESVFRAVAARDETIVSAEHQAVVGCVLQSDDIIGHLRCLEPYRQQLQAAIHDYYDSYFPAETVRDLSVYYKSVSGALAAASLILFLVLRMTAGKKWNGLVRLLGKMRNRLDWERQGWLTKNILSPLYSVGDLLPVGLQLMKMAGMIRKNDTADQDVWQYYEFSNPSRHAGTTDAFVRLYYYQTRRFMDEYRGHLNARRDAASVNADELLKSHMAMLYMANQFVLALLVALVFSGIGFFMNFTDKVEPYAGMALAILGCAVAAAIPRLSVQDLKQKEAQWKDHIMEHFPDFVSRFNMGLVGRDSGGALRLILQDSSDEVPRSRHASFEQELLLLSERYGTDYQMLWKAIARHFDIPEVTKFAILCETYFDQTEKLSEQLTYLTMELWANKKAVVLKKGAHATTRLLLPMMVLLFIVLVIVAYPALQNFN
jgi:hypothetical protein